MRPAFVLIGVPGAGKTTLAKALVGNSDTLLRGWTVGEHVASLGWFTKPLGGVDALAGKYHKMPSQEIVERIAAARELWPDHALVLDSPRFDLVEVGTKVPLAGIVLRCPAHVAEARCNARGSAIMSRAWHDGRQAALAKWESRIHVVAEIDATASPDEVIAAAVHAIEVTL